MSVVLTRGRNDANSGTRNRIVASVIARNSVADNLRDECHNNSVRLASTPARKLCVMTITQDKANQIFEIGITVIVKGCVVIAAVKLYIPLKKQVSMLFPLLLLEI